MISASIWSWMRAIFKFYIHKQHSGAPATCKSTRRHKIINVFTQLRGMASTGNNICQTLFQGHVMWCWVYQNHDVYNCVAPLQTKSTKSLPYLLSWCQTQFKRNKWVPAGFLAPSFSNTVLGSLLSNSSKMRYMIYRFLKPIMHLYTFVKRTPKAELLIYSIVHAVYTFFLHLWCGQISIPVIMCMLPHCHNMWWIEDTKDSFQTTQTCRSFAQKSSPVRPSGIWLQATHASNKVQLEEFQAANSWQRHQEHKIGAATRNEQPSSDWHQSSIMTQSSVPLFSILPLITTISHAAEPETTKDAWLQCWNQRVARTKAPGAEEYLRRIDWINL